MSKNRALTVALAATLALSGCGATADVPDCAADDLIEGDRDCAGLTGSRRPSARPSTRRPPASRPAAVDTRKPTSTKRNR